MAKAPKTAAEAPAADAATTAPTTETPITAPDAAAAASPDAAPPASNPAPVVDPAPPADPATLPSQIKMLSPHGFIDDATGQHRYWQQHQVVFDPADIALLHERKANFEAVESAPAKQ